MTESDKEGGGTLYKVDWDRYIFFIEKMGNCEELREAVMEVANSGIQTNWSVNKVIFSKFN